MVGRGKAPFDILLASNAGLTELLLRSHQKFLTSPSLVSEAESQPDGGHVIPTLLRVKYGAPQLWRRDNKQLQSAPFIFHLLAWILTKRGPQHWQCLTSLATKCSESITLSNHTKSNWRSASAAFFQHNSAQKSVNYRTNLAVYICTAFLTCNQKDEAANCRADGFKLEQIMHSAASLDY